MKATQGLVWNINLALDEGASENVQIDSQGEVLKKHVFNRPGVAGAVL